MQDEGGQDPICHSGMRPASLKSEASRNADIPSTAGRLPDSHSAIPISQSTHAAENTQLSHIALDWKAACLLLSRQEEKTTCKRQRHTSEAHNASTPPTSKAQLGKWRTFSRAAYHRSTEVLIDFWAI